MDAWGEMGNEGWSFEVMEPYFRKFGTTNPPTQKARDAVGLKYLDESLPEAGPLKISFGDDYNIVNKSWVETLTSLGLGMTADPRTGKAMGVFQNPASIDPKTKTRSYAATAYYGDDVRRRPNLVVKTRTLVTKILTTVQGDQVVATGVRIRDRDGNEEEITASREVILAAGAMQSPQILELSGIGGRALLESLDIPVVIDNPNVGEHMQEHPMVTQSFEVKDGVPSGDAFRDPAVVDAVIKQYKTSRAGPMAQSSLAMAYVPLSDGSGALSPEKTKALLDAYLPSAAKTGHPAQDREESLLRSLLETPSEPALQYLMIAVGTNVAKVPKRMGQLLYSRPENFLSIMTILNHPFSRGSCHITSADVAVKPTWDPKFNANPLDLELLAHNVLFVEKIIATEPLRSLLKEGGARMPEIVGSDLERAREIVRQRQICCFHLCGSCAMLPRELGGVVSERLLVYGTKNLRVVDASIFPLEPLGNIQTTVYAVAERAADLIKEDRKAAASASAAI